MWAPKKRVLFCLFTTVESVELLLQIIVDHEINSEVTAANPEEDMETWVGKDRCTHTVVYMHAHAHTLAQTIPYCRCRHGSLGSGFEPGILEKPSPAH